MPILLHLPDAVVVNYDQASQLGERKWGGRRRRERRLGSGGLPWQAGYMAQVCLEYPFQPAPGKDDPPGTAGRDKVPLYPVGLLEAALLYGLIRAECW